jgi:Bacterial pre-peptidase C-terminal domain
MKYQSLWPFAWLALATPGFAQLPAARLNSVFPPGAKAGTTVECTVAGQDLDDLSGLYFSKSGISAESLGPNKFKVTIADTVPVGPVDVRGITSRGLTNFRAFSIGDRPEAIEAEPNDALDKAQRVSLPIVVEGRIDKATDVDHYVFAAKKGQRILVDCWAWRIDSLLDGTLLLLDAKGKELDSSGDYYGKDPFLDFTVPEDGDYVVKVWDFVYGGGSDYVYQLRIGADPHLDALLPAAIKPGEKATITLLGRNLPGAEHFDPPMLEAITREVEIPNSPASLQAGEAVRPPQATLDGMPFRLVTPEGASNPIFLGFAADPVVIEREPNAKATEAQEIPFPSEVSGTFDPPGDVDFYAFKVPKGEKAIIETIGERQTGLVDPFLAGFDPSGKRVFSADDSNGRNIGQLRFTTSTRDVRWEFTSSNDGLCRVQVRDLYFQQRGEPRFRYRLSVRRPRPDFRLVAVPTHDVHPDASRVGRGGRAWLDLLVHRADGFDGPIQIEVAGLPPGVTCEPVVVGPDEGSVPVVFLADKEAPIGHADLTITGKATIDGQEMTRVARGGGLTWPTVNTPGIARMADSIPLAVREAPPFVLTASPETLELALGAKLAIPIKLSRAADWSESVQLSGFELPKGATVPLVTIPANQTEAKVELTLPANLKPGEYTFTINGAGQVPKDYDARRDPKANRGNKVRAIFPSNPITIRVVAKAP